MAIFASVSNGQHTMIQFSAATFFFEVDSRVIELEWFAACIDSNWDGSNGGESFLQCIFISRWNVNETSVGSSWVFWLVLASVINGFIWVCFFCVDTAVVLDVLESIVHEATVTAVIAIRPGAIDQILFRQWNQFFALSEMLTFQRTSGWKTPTAEISGERIMNLSKCRDYFSQYDVATDLPQWPWSLTGVTAPSERQSTSVGTSTLAGAMKKTGSSTGLLINFFVGLNYSNKAKPNNFLV